MRNHLSISVEEESQVGDARRLAVRLAGEAGLDEADGGKVAIVATELARNLVKFGKEGELLVCSIKRRGASGVELVAIDKGPGMADVARSMEDGYSTSGTPGTGLGAVRRMADAMDIYSQPGHGTVVLARVLEKRPEKGAPHRFEVGAVNVPVKGETRCGDGWSAHEENGRLITLVADGLGHGPEAAEAADGAIAVMEENAGRSPCEMLDEMHAALRSTRGAAVSVAEIHAGAEEMKFAGIGNVAGAVVIRGATKNMVSHNGTLGHAMRHCQDFSYPWGRGALLVMHSDGITSQWEPRNYPGLLLRDPTVIAAVIYRDFKRGRDDATVLVAREKVA